MIIQRSTVASGKAFIKKNGSSTDLGEKVSIIRSRNGRSGHKNGLLGDINKTCQPMNEPAVKMTKEDQRLVLTGNTLLETLDRCIIPEEGVLARKDKKELVQWLMGGSKPAGVIAKKMELFAISKCETVPGDAFLLIDLLHMAGRVGNLEEIRRRAPEQISDYADKFL